MSNTKITLDFEHSGWTPAMLAAHMEGGSRGARWVAKQIRSQMKPAEPTLAGSVVIDRDGRRWYRVANGEQVNPTWHSYNQDPRFYADIDVDEIARRGL